MIRFHKSSSAVLIAGVLFLGLGWSPKIAAAQTSNGLLKTPSSPVATPSFALSVFAFSESGYSQPDSLAQWKNSIFIGYGNHAAPDGSDGKSSTVVQYSMAGEVQHIFLLKGHNDGLHVIGDLLITIQNEDANPRIVTINPVNGQQRVYTFPPAPHGGGYDDLTIKDGKAYISASNPKLNALGANVHPALDMITFRNGQILLTPVLNGSNTAIDIPTGKPVTLNLTDPDSLTTDPRGNLVLDSQGDGELVFVQNPLTDDQSVGRLSLTVNGKMATVDDTTFVKDPKGFLLMSDRDGEKVYRIDNKLFGFEPGTAYSASDTLGLVGSLNLNTGALTPIATGFASPHGMIFVSDGN